MIIELLKCFEEFIPNICADFKLLKICADFYKNFSAAFCGRVADLRRKNCLQNCADLRSEKIADVVVLRIVLIGF